LTKRCIARGPSTYGYRTRNTSHRLPHSPLRLHHPPQLSSTVYGPNAQQFPSSRLAEWTLAAAQEKYYIRSLRPPSLAAYIRISNCLARRAATFIVFHHATCCTASTYDFLHVRVVFHIYGGQFSSISHQSWTTMSWNITGEIAEGIIEGNAVVGLREAFLVKSGRYGGALIDMRSR